MWVVFSQSFPFENLPVCSLWPPVEQAASSHHALLHPLLGCAHLSDATWNASVRAGAAKPRNPKQILSVKTRLHVQTTVSNADWNVSQAVAFFRPLTLFIGTHVYACMHTSKHSYMHRCMIICTNFTMIIHILLQLLNLDPTKLRNSPVEHIFYIQTSTKSIYLSLNLIKCHFLT